MHDVRQKLVSAGEGKQTVIRYNQKTTKIFILQLNNGHNSGQNKTRPEHCVKL